MDEVLLYWSHKITNTICILVVNLFLVAAKEDGFIVSFKFQPFGVGNASIQSHFHVETVLYRFRTSSQAYHVEFMSIQIPFFFLLGWDIFVHWNSTEGLSVTVIHPVWLLYYGV